MTDQDEYLLPTYEVDETTVGEQVTVRIVDADDGDRVVDSAPVRTDGLIATLDSMGHRVIGRSTDGRLQVIRRE